VFDVHRAEPGDMSKWEDDDLNLLIDEGRRQLDRQGSDLEQIRGRAQFLFTTTLAGQQYHGLHRFEIAMFNELVDEYNWAFSGGQEGAPRRFGLRET
jgi:hypothetical protein